MRRALPLLFLLGACATERGRTSWEDDARDGVPIHTARRELPTRAEPRAPSTIGTRAEAAPVDAAQREADLELALMRFGAKRRQIAAQHPPSEKGWPRPLEAAFLDVIGGFHRGLEGLDGELPRRVLIQARVTIEAELENAIARYGDPPRALVEQAKGLFAVISLQMAKSRPLREERERERAERSVALVWPVAPVVVTSAFGYRRDPILGRDSVRFHAGVDLGGDSGTLVHAAGDGRVVSAGWLGGHGRVVIVQHPGGYQTVYAHLRQILVSAGAEVDAGAPVGLMGSSGRSTGPHLHFEVRRGGVPLDPLDALGPSFPVASARP